MCNVVHPSGPAFSSHPGGKRSNAIFEQILLMANSSLPYVVQKLDCSKRWRPEQMPKKSSL